MLTSSRKWQMLKRCWPYGQQVRPDLVLLDWELPGLAERQYSRQRVQRSNACCPNVQIIVLSGRPEAGRPALAAGASSFVSKADPPERLLAALHHAKG